MTDPIADMLTRIRNALVSKHDTVEIPASNIKKEIARILVDEGYIKSADIENDGVQGKIVVTLKYGSNNQKVINGLKRISKPGLRVYTDAGKMPKVFGGLGIAIVSTSSGIMTDKQARNAGKGGEVLAYVW